MSGTKMWKIVKNINDNSYYLVCEDEPVEEIPAVIDNNEDDDDDQLHSHTVIISQDDDGKTISCQQCKMAYNSVDDFTLAHNVQVSHDELVEESEFIEEPLWELVPDDVQTTGTLSFPYNNEEKQEQTPVILENHVAMDSNGVPDQFGCMACHNTFDDLQTAENHDCSSKQELIIKREEEEFQEQGEQKELTSAHNSFVEYGCEHCGNLFATYEKFQEHQKKQSSCATGNPLAIKMELNAHNAHMRTHNKKQISSAKLDSYSCDLCNATFSTKRCLDLHGKSHETRAVRSIEEALPAHVKQDYPQGDQFYCEICDKRFDSNLLLVHKNMHLSDKANTISTTCRICNIEFECKETYDMHMMLHEGKNIHKLAQIEPKNNEDNPEYRFSCQYCERTFKRAYEKVNHERVHTGEKPYECQVCGKRFRTSYSLTIHLRTHTDVRPFECEVCHKCYKSYTTYAHHMNTHSSERNYKCDVCSKRFSTSVQLCGHRKIHSRPFVCTICKRAFASIVNWRSHMRLKHSKTNEKNNNDKNILLDGKKATCPICGAVYVRSVNLRQHLKTQHGIEEISPAPSPVGDLNPHELDEMDLMGTNFLAAREEIVTDEYNEHEEQETEKDYYHEVDEQSALLIAVAKAAELQHKVHYDQKQVNHYNAAEVEAAEQMIHI